MVRTIAGVFVTLIERIPELETTAFVLITIIALKMLLGIVGIHIPHFLFFFILIGAFTVTIIICYLNKGKVVEEN